MLKPINNSLITTRRKNPRKSSKGICNRLLFTLPLQSKFNRSTQTIKNKIGYETVQSTFRDAAQTTVKGVLTDENLGEAEPFATVRVFKHGKTDKPVAMFLTKEDGSFSQQVKGKGRYDIVFSSVGKEDLKQTITLSNQGTLDLGTLLIKENATMLKGVEIVAQKPLVKMDVDKMSYNVAEDEDAKSNTVLDMLRKVPMVTVDGQDNITVNGSSMVCPT